MSCWGQCRDPAEGQEPWPGAQPVWPSLPLTLPRRPGRPPPPSPAPRGQSPCSPRNPAPLRAGLSAGLGQGRLVGRGVEDRPGARALPQGPGPPACRERAALAPGEATVLGASVSPCALRAWWPSPRPTSSLREPSAHAVPGRVCSQGSQATLRGALTLRLQRGTPHLPKTRPMSPSFRNSEDSRALPQRPGAAHTGFRADRAWDVALGSRVRAGPGPSGRAVPSPCWGLHGCLSPHGVCSTPLGCLKLGSILFRIVLGLQNSREASRVLRPPPSLPALHVFRSYNFCLN